MTCVLCGAHEDITVAGYVDSGTLPAHPLYACATHTAPLRAYLGPDALTTDDETTTGSTTR